MKVFQKVFLLTTLLFSTSFFAQEAAIPVVKDTVISNWEKKNTVGLDITQIAFVNWNAGGNSSVSGLLKGNFVRKYTTDNVRWVNELIFKYF